MQLTMVGIEEGLVIASVTALAAASVFQIRGILNGSKSALVGWLIWTVVNAVSLAAQYYAGSTIWELMIPISQLTSTAVLLLLSAWVLLRRRERQKERINWRSGLWGVIREVTRCINFGVRRICRAMMRISWGDAIAFTWCVIGVSIGITLNNPFIALWGNVAANVAGLVPMFISGRRHPASVTRNYWALRGLSTVFATAVFLLGGINGAGLIPQAMGLVIAASMLYASLAPPKRRRALNTLEESDPHPMLSIGGSLR